MRRIRYSVAMSLDGYIAGPNGEADWIVIDPDIDFESMFKEFDTVLIGAHSYAAMGPGSSPGKLFGMTTFVFSRTLQQREHPEVTIVSQDASEILTALRAQRGKDIWLFGGGILFRSLLELGMVDAIEVAVIPVLLGNGIPLLPAPSGKANLTLVDHKRYPKTGTVLLQYEVQNQPAAT